MLKALLLVAGLTLLLAPAMVVAGDLKPGDTAPAFSLPGSDGKTHVLADYAGKAVVVAWFPKAFTGG
jgi:peroxiredoxin Q/BCP